MLTDGSGHGRGSRLASTERLLSALDGASGGELGCVTWYAFARGLVTSHADLLDYRGEPFRNHPKALKNMLVQPKPATDEYAVMMDTFRPLKVAKQALDIEDPAYHRSWIDAQHAAFNPPTT